MSGWSVRDARRPRCREGVVPEQVDEIAARFVKLSPYADKSRSILKIERDNYDPETGEQRQVYCLAISAKRYALFLRDEHGDPVLLQKAVNNHEDRWSEHGLGHLRNPINPRQRRSRLDSAVVDQYHPWNFRFTRRTAWLRASARCWAGADYESIYSAFIGKTQSWKEISRPDKTI